MVPLSELVQTRPIFVVCMSLWEYTVIYYPPKK